MNDSHNVIHRLKQSTHSTKEFSRFEMLMGQAKGLMIIANWHKSQGNTQVYLNYLKRIQILIAKMESTESMNCVKLAA